MYSQRNVFSALFFPPGHVYILKIDHNEEVMRAFQLIDNEHSCMSFNIILQPLFCGYMIHLLDINIIFFLN